MRSRKALELLEGLRSLVSGRWREPSELLLDQTSKFDAGVIVQVRPNNLQSAGELRAGQADGSDRGGQVNPAA